MRLTKPVLAWGCLVGAISLVAAQEPTAPARPQYSPAQVFKQWDKNGDGKLTADEVPNANLIKMLDKNSDGSVSSQEAAALGRGGAGTEGKWRGAQAPDGDTGQRQQWRGVGVS